MQSQQEKFQQRCLEDLKDSVGTKKYQRPKALVINSEALQENSGVRSYIPPDPKNFNFYVDAAVRGNEAFIVVVVFDRDGGFVDALSAKAAIASVLEAECLALCHAFSLCVKWGCREANFFLDCLQLVAAINKFVIPITRVPHSIDKLPNCHGLNSVDLTSATSMDSELSIAARSPQGVGVTSSVKSNHLGAN
ncbi:hypothetical protein G4B88_022032 [Cannabis sativa]|uniref:RNase H type-1 domain-containing protein n=1 Tax=Cannabis sativa TaxID=3483 RepID=A0A7J6FUD9_CANSA|nr:hypothetical protein G4B88_022032 [Cannabis sativa]